MGQFSVKTKQARIQADEEQKLMRELESLEESIRSISSNLGFKVASKANIRNRLNQAANQIDAHQRSMSRMRSALIGVLNDYDKTEQKILGNAKIKKLQAFEPDVMEYSADKSFKSNREAEKRRMQQLHGGGGSGRLKDADLTLWDSLKDNFGDDFGGNFLDDLRNAFFEGTGNTIVKVGGLLNIKYAIGSSNTGNTSFVMLNPSVVSKTSKIISVGNKIATGAKYGLPVIGGIIDYASLRNDGESVINAGTKAIAHVGIGLAGGKAGAAIGAAVGSVIPGAGTAVGAVVGFVAGVAVTTVGNLVFDHVYDKYLAKHVENAGKAIKETAKETVNTVKEIAKGIGAAFTSGWNQLGTAFG